MCVSTDARRDRVDWHAVKSESSDDTVFFSDLQTRVGIGDTHGEKRKVGMRAMRAMMIDDSDDHDGGF